MDTTFSLRLSSFAANHLIKFSIMRLPVLLFLFFLVFYCCEKPPPSSESTTKTFQNPIIEGFAPDPSICRVGDDFYLINSTFEYFPGIPIYHSTDLVNWKLIANALHDPAQVNMDTINSSSGIHAPTIRYHDGLFYIITTNNLNGKMVNFIITAKDPKGPWSEAYILTDAPGIDPSLFFDDDGKVWYTGMWVPPDPEFDGQAEIWLQELDMEKMDLVGEKHYLWRGACDGTWAEGPHIYKRNGYYYLLIAEGGTLHNHAVTIAISKNIKGPYQSNERNPILTHRHLSINYPIIAVGHADMIEWEGDQWYMVALGFRPIDGQYKNLGRETYLIPVQWETEPFWWKEEKLSWPVCSPQSGKVELEFPLPIPETRQQRLQQFTDNFDEATLHPEWNFRRTPKQTFYSLSDQNGVLRLRLQPGFIARQGQYSFAGIRQRHFQMEASTKVQFSPADKEEAGMIAIQNDRSAYVLSLAKGRVQVHQFFHGKDSLIASHPYEREEVFFKILADYLDYNFYYSENENDWNAIAENVDGSDLSPESSGWTYTGVYVGLYASANGKSTTNHADFDWFKYSSLVEDDKAWFYRRNGSKND